MIEKRIVIIAVLALLAVILTIVRESTEIQGEPFSFIPTMKKSISGDEVYAMADTALQSFGIKKTNIRPMKNRNDVRVFIPESFDPIVFVKMMNILLEDYSVSVVSVENTKERSSLIQIKDNETIIKSFIFTFERVPVARKGVSSSVPKKQTR